MNVRMGNVITHVTFSYFISYLQVSYVNIPGRHYIISVDRFISCLDCIVD